MESSALTGLVNSLLGLTNVDVDKLIETLRKARELLERGELINE